MVPFLLSLLLLFTSCQVESVLTEEQSARITQLETEKTGLQNDIHVLESNGKGLLEALAEATESGQDEDHPDGGDHDPDNLSVHHPEPHVRGDKSDDPKHYAYGAIGATFI